MNDALIVLAIGMITVFIILGLVVLSGQLLIKIVNSRFKEEQTITSSIAPEHNNVSISSQKVAAIVAAVDIFTEGQGMVHRIQRVED